MKGSEKQIKWAEDIKENFYKASFRTVILRGDDVEAVLKTMAESEIEADRRDYDIYTRIMAVEDAKWWIDNRNALKGGYLGLSRQERKGRFTVGA